MKYIANVYDNDIVGGFKEVPDNYQLGQWEGWTTKSAYDLYKKYSIITPLTNPDTNKPWVGNEMETWISNQLFKQENSHLAREGQLVEIAIELNDSVKGHLEEKIMTTQQKINDKVVILLSPGLTDPALRQKHWNELLSIKAPYQTTLSYLKIVNAFERSLAIAITQDPKHPVHFFDEDVFIQILTEIKNLPPQDPMIIPQRPSLWYEITKMVSVEESYEPKPVVDEWKKILNSIHDGISYTAGATQPAIDPNARPGGSETLAGQLPTDAGGTQT